MRLIDRSKRLLPAAATLLAALMASPGAALACSVCQGGTSDNRVEFIATTAFLTFLPLGMIGGLIWYLRRRYLALASQPPSDAPEIHGLEARR